MSQTAVSPKWAPLCALIERAWQVEGVGQVQVLFRWHNVAEVSLFGADARFGSEEAATRVLRALGADETEIKVIETADSLFDAARWVVAGGDGMRVSVMAAFPSRQLATA